MNNYVNFVDLLNLQSVDIIGFVESDFIMKCDFYVDYILSFSNCS